MNHRHDFNDEKIYKTGRENRVLIDALRPKMMYSLRVRWPREPDEAFEGSDFLISVVEIAQEGPGHIVVISWRPKDQSDGASMPVSAASFVVTDLGTDNEIEMGYFVGFGIESSTENSARVEQKVPVTA